MDELIPKEEFGKIWTKLYGDAKTEIFRLQLLDTYTVESEERFLTAYKEGRRLPIPEDSGYFKTMEQKKKEGVRILNLLVVDLPLSLYTRWVTEDVYTVTEKKGQETLMVDRKTVDKITRGKTDYWMFDDSIVMPMRYDEEGHFLGAGRPIEDKRDIAQYSSLKKDLLGVAEPMRVFLRDHNQTPPPKRMKDRN